MSNNNNNFNQNLNLLDEKKEKLDFFFKQFTIFLKKFKKDYDVKIIHSELKSVHDIVRIFLHDFSKCFPETSNQNMKKYIEKELGEKKEEKKNDSEKLFINTLRKIKKIIEKSRDRNMSEQNGEKKKVISSKMKKTIEECLDSIITNN